LPFLYTFLKTPIKYLQNVTDTPYNLINYQPVKIIILSVWEKILTNFKKLNLYYIRNEHLWLDGFLFDFLQKKTADI